MESIEENPGASGAQQLKNFRQSMKVARRQAGMTQTDLANAMNERGHTFRQQTIQKIESGDRSLQFDEAAEIAEVIGVPLERLAKNSSALETLTTVYEHAKSLAESEGAARGYLERCLELRVKVPATLRLAATIDEARDLAEVDQDTFRDAVDGLERWLSVSSPDELLTKLKVRHLIAPITGEQADESSAT